MNVFALHSGVYDFLKKLITIVLPALTGFIAALGAIYEWDVAQIVQAGGALALFLGAVVGVSNASYQRTGGGVAGDLQVVGYVDDDGGEVKTTVVSFNHDPGLLKDGQDIHLRYKETPVDISDL